MTNFIILSVVIATVIVYIIDFLKPAYKKFTGKYAVSINIAISFLLGILAAFSFKGFIEIEANTGMLILWGLALGTGSNLFYDVWALIKGLKNKLEASIKG